VTDAGLGELVASYAFTTLSSLSLRACTAITDHGIAAALNRMGTFHSLRTLDVSNTKADR
jgi:hypothetical protein